MPVSIIFNKENSGSLSPVEYWEPSDGSLYLPSIHAKFPRSMWDSIDTQAYIADHSLTALRNAQNHYAVIDHTAPEIICLKPLEIKKGTKPNWEDYFKIVDDTDGQIDLSEAYIWDTTIDSDRSGKYSLHVIVLDNAGNENRSFYEVTIE